MSKQAAPRQPGWVPAGRGRGLQWGGTEEEGTGATGGGRVAMGAGTGQSLAGAIPGSAYGLPPAEGGQTAAISWTSSRDSWSVKGYRPG